jgi:dihydrofolate reductase
MIISLICATSQNGVIGLNNQLPWHLPADLAHFKKLTMGHHILMGRKTYESIGRPLPGRTNIVITRQQNFQADGCLIVHSLEEAIELCQGDDEVFVIGGAEIYQQTLPVADKIYLTIIHQDFEGDTLLFEIDKTIWREITRKDFEPDEKNKFDYSFLTLEKSEVNNVHHTNTGGKTK